MIKLPAVVLDPYDRRARLYPALLSVFPVLMACAVFLPQYLGKDFLGILGSLTTASGGLALATHIARDRGKVREGAWFETMGGKPSTAMLRHRDLRMNALDKARYHAFLARQVPGIVLPSTEDELRNPGAADTAYDSATTWLREQTRDKDRFSLLFIRNVEFGFRRNLTGMRGIALAADLVLVFCIAAVLAAQHFGWLPDGFLPPPMAVIAVLGITALHAVLAATMLRPAWIVRAAEEYARQLLAACDVLTSGSSGPKLRKKVAPRKAVPTA